MLLNLLFLSLAIQEPALVQAQTRTPPSTQKPVQPTSSQRNKSRPVFRWQKPPGGLSTIPGRVEGMGSRNLCPLREMTLRALVPYKQRELPDNKLSSQPSIDVLGLTTDERPTFWFYLPYTKDMANFSAEFILQDSDDNQVYQQAITLPTTPEIISVNLPSTVMPLKVNKNYHWFFVVNCSGEENVPIYVEGDIQRINLNPSLVADLATATQRDKVAIYAENGIWFDALTLLVKLRQEHPDDASLVSDWFSLLDSINVEKSYAEAPLSK